MEEEIPLDEKFLEGMSSSKGISLDKKKEFENLLKQRVKVPL